MSYELCNASAQWEGPGEYKGEPFQASSQSISCYIGGNMESVECPDAAKLF